MSKKERTIYIDISEFLLNRKTTGIQRVIRELITRLLNYNSTLHILTTKKESTTFMKLDNEELPSFLKNIQNYSFKNFTNIDIYSENSKNKIFLDIDTVWNAKISRETLYPKLKASNFKIYNFIYDLIPLLFPEYLYAKSKENFPTYLQSVYKYSDLVIFNSNSSKNDFLELKKNSLISRGIPTKTITLGSNYTNVQKRQESNYKHLLSTKYLLFVGTIEPRKGQLQVLEVYEEIQKTNPNLHLIFIGKIGWGVDAFINKLSKHPLKDKTIHHLRDIDDNELTLFYKNAFLVTYISKYEGYGLPLAESLSHHNVTIASRNSSMAEFSDEYIDFLENDSNEALKKLLKHYIENPNNLDLKRNAIQKNYKIITWDSFYTNLINIIENFDILTPLHLKASR